MQMCLYKYFIFQICFYFHLKFNNLSIQTKSLLINSKLNPKFVCRKVYLIINVHNAICWKLKRFNDFWKFDLISEFVFFLIMIWFFTYEVVFDIKLVLYNRLLFVNWLMIFSSLLSLFIQVYGQKGADKRARTKGRGQKGAIGLYPSVKYQPTSQPTNQIAN